MRAAVQSLLGVLFVACVDTPTTPSTNVIGHTYDVVAIDGNTVPASVVLFTFRPPCTPGKIARSEMRFLADGVLEHVSWTEGQDPTSAGSLFRTSYRARSDHFIDISDQRAAGWLSRDTLYLRLNGHFTCQVNSWVAVARSSR